MKIENVPFTLTDWNKIQTQVINGESGFAESKVIEQGNIRARLINYSSNYKADHWCLKGHIAFVIEGEFTIEIENGRKFEFTKGMGFQVADDIDAHKAYSKNGATVFIVD